MTIFYCHHLISIDYQGIQGRSKRSGWSGFGRTSFQSRRGAVLRVAYVRVRSALVGGARAEHVVCYLHRSRNVKRAYIRGRPGMASIGGVV